MVCSARSGRAWPCSDTTSCVRRCTWTRAGRDVAPCIASSGAYWNSGVPTPASRPATGSAGGEPSRARPLFVEAVRRSCVVHAYRDAAAAARKALELWPEAEDESERLAVLEQLGRCAQACGELGEARRAWEEVAASLGRATDRQRLAEVMRGLATVYALEGDRGRESTAPNEGCGGVRRRRK